MSIMRKTENPVPNHTFITYVDAEGMHHGGFMEEVSLHTGLTRGQLKKKNQGSKLSGAMVFVNSKKGTTPFLTL
jgi:hypothetical protein